MSDILHIQIPAELARYSVWQRSLVNKYQTNSIIKALDTWLVLKAESIPSIIGQWNEQKGRLLQICKCSESIFRTRLKLLKEMKLIKYDRYSIRLCSWDELGKALEIDVDKKEIIRYDIYNKQRLQEWLIASEIKDSQQRQAYMITKKLNKNPELKLKIIHAMIAAGADRTRIKEPGYVLSWLNVLYKNDFYRASEIHDELILLRPDTNRGVRGISKAWSRCDKSKEENDKEIKKNVCRIVYWKKVLKKSGIIDISKLQIESTSRSRNQFCYVLWLPACKNSPRKEVKQTLLCLCDQIQILTPWSASDLEKTIAA